MNKPEREGFVTDEPIESGAKSAEQPPQYEPPTESWPVVVKLLHKPVRNNKNELVHELTFREPTGGEINRYGNPVRIDQAGDAIIDERKMTLIMAALSGVLSPLLDRMDPRDWNSCAYRLRNFFLPDFRAW